MKKLFITTIGLLFTLLTNAQYTNEINTNRPSSSMGAYSVSKGIFQVEGGFQYQNDEYHTEKKNVQNNINLQIRYGEIWEQLEFIADFQLSNYQQTNFNYNHSATGFKQVTLGAKYLIYDHYKYYVEKRNVYSWKANQRFKWGRLIPAVSVFVGANFNSSHNFYYPELPGIGLKAILIAQQHLSKRFSITYNFIGENITDEAFTSYNYIVTASLGLNDKWSIFGEHQGIIDKKYSSEQIPLEKEAHLKAGLTYKIHPNMQLDAFAGTSIDNTPHKIQAGLGLSWRNHKKYQFKDPTEL